MYWLLISVLRFFKRLARSTLLELCKLILRLSVLWMDTRKYDYPGGTFGRVTHSDDGAFSILEELILKMRGKSQSVRPGDSSSLCPCKIRSEIVVADVEVLKFKPYHGVGWPSIWSCDRSLWQTRGGRTWVKAQYATIWSIWVGILQAVLPCMCYLWASFTCPHIGEFYCCSLNLSIIRNRHWEKKDY